NAGFARDLSVSYERLGDLARSADQTDEAVDHFQASLGIWRRLAEASPSVVDYRYGQRVPLGRLAGLVVDRDADAAARYMGDVVTIVSEAAHRQGVDGPAQRELSAVIDQAMELRGQITGVASSEVVQQR